MSNRCSKRSLRARPGFASRNTAPRSDSTASSFISWRSMGRRPRRQNCSTRFSPGPWAGERCGPGGPEWQGRRNSGCPGGRSICAWSIDHENGRLQRRIGANAARPPSIRAINIARSETGFFPDLQVELLRTFADQAVIAIENVRLFDEVQARTTELTETLLQQTATADVLKVISRAAASTSRIQHEMKSAAALCGASYGRDLPARWR